MQEKITINRNLIPTPKVSFSALANEQIQMIIKNDITLEEKHFRISISGKGCDGFSYSVGFTELREDDFVISLNHLSEINSDSIKIIMDPFAAFYLQDCTVDYIQDFSNDNEGFVVKNKNQKNFSGKFWRKEKQGKDVVPPLL